VGQAERTHRLHRVQILNELDVCATRVFHAQAEAPAWAYHVRWLTHCCPLNKGGRGDSMPTYELACRKIPR